MQNKNVIKILLICIIVICVTLLSLAFLRGDEDSWVCENGEWIKHGNPFSKMPKTECKKNDLEKTPEISNYINNEKNIKISFNSEKYLMENDCYIGGAAIFRPFLVGGLKDKNNSYPYICIFKLNEEAFKEYFNKEDFSIVYNKNKFKINSLEFTEEQSNELLTYYYYFSEDFNEDKERIMIYGATDEEAHAETMKIEKDFINNSIYDIKENNSDVENKIVYKNKELGISFEYNKKMGDILAEKNDNILMLFLQGYVDMPIFLSANNGEKSIGRGAFWGDEALFIKNKEYIENYCKDKKNCEVKTNKNGIMYAKVKENYPVVIMCEAQNEISESQEECEYKETTFYYIYNSFNQYRGLVLTNHSLLNIKELSALNLEKELDELVDSIKITQ